MSKKQQTFALTVAAIVVGGILLAVALRELGLQSS